MKPNNQSQKSIQLISDYSYYDIFLSKKYHECGVRIPQTILLDKGMVKQWIFNSSKLQNSPILKKKRLNLTPLNVLKAFCSKLGYASAVVSCLNAIDLKNEVKNLMKDKKDYDYVKDKKPIEITTVDNEVFQLSLIDFLNMAAQNKYSESMFYEKWKIIQEKVTFSKIDQTYEVESVRKNHLIESKCQKIISINSGLATGSSTELLQQQGKQSPKKAEQTEQKNVEGYKFFDTFLNKKFFQMSEQLAQTIQKNFKCIIESMLVKYVINKNREPFFMGIKNLVIKPAKKISQMRDFNVNKQKGFIKIDQYNKILFIYIMDYLQKNNSHEQPNQIKLNSKKCRGGFCDCRSLIADQSFVLDQKSKLPSLIKPYRHINSKMILAVQKIKRKVIQKMKLHSLISPDYFVLQGDSSDYESDYDQNQLKNLKVCQNCFLFYQNVRNIFDFDSLGNLNEKKIPTVSFKSYFQQKGKQKIQTHNQILDEINTKQVQLEEITKRIQQRKKNAEISQNKTNQRQRIHSLKASSSHAKFINQKEQRQKQKKTKEELLLKAQSKNKLTPILNDFKDQASKGQSLISLNKIQHLNLTERVKPIKPQIKKVPQNFQEAKYQFLDKIQTLSATSDQQFIYLAKKYYIDNLTHITQRRGFSSIYFTNIYQFNNHTPLNLSSAYRIKKRPQMTMKRLSQLTDYPEIISKSTFIFETLICDENTTIPYCIITSKMLGTDDVKNLKYQNIIIVHDLFDSFIEHIGLAKNMIQNLNNKRVILFNRPGQSHTIYNENKLNTIDEFCQVVQKLIYRLSGEKNQRKILDFQADSFKFIGIGYGGYLLASYLSYYHYYYNNLSGVLLVNSFKSIPASYRKIIEQLLQIYLTNSTKKDHTHEFLCYNIAIKSSQIQKQDLERKEQLNSIRQIDRIYLLKSVIADIDNETTIFFNEISQSPVHILYGLSNSVVSKKSAQEFLVYEKDQKQTETRKFFEADGGHDLCADNNDEMQFRFKNFALLNMYS